jgi:hypothetical protein
MKKASFLLLAITLTFVAACQPAENQNRNANANANASANANRNQALFSLMGPKDKIVQIFVHDDPVTKGNYLVEDPGSVTLYRSWNQTIQWCVMYDGKTPPDEVVIDSFRYPPPPAPTSATSPFDNGSTDPDVYHVAAATFNDCKMVPNTPKASATKGEYKYTITVKVAGAPKGNRDPQVVIDN